MRPDQPDNPGFSDPFLKAVDEDVVVDPVKELLQVYVSPRSDGPIARMTAPQGRRHARLGPAGSRGCAR